MLRLRKGCHVPDTNSGGGFYLANAETVEEGFTHKILVIIGATRTGGGLTSD